MTGITSVSGITLRTKSMARALHFYRDILGLRMLYGDEKASFSSFKVGGTYFNLELSGIVESDWGRVIFYCDDVDTVYEHLRSRGYEAPAPKDAPWGERFFHISDPDGHELSIAKRIQR